MHEYKRSSVAPAVSHRTEDPHKSTRGECGTTNADRAEMGITVRGPSGRHLAPPATAPITLVESGQRLTHQPQRREVSRTSPARQQTPVPSLARPLRSQDKLADGLHRDEKMVRIVSELGEAILQVEALRCVVDRHDLDRVDAEVTLGPADATERVDQQM